MSEGTVFIVSAPSGAGKTTLLNELLKRNTEQRLVLSVSYTTRQIRADEVNGRDYHFVSLEEFKSLQECGEMLEYAEVFGNYYGTGKQWIKQQLREGKDVILEIDVQGALQVMQKIEDTCSIFIFPPSMLALRNRLVKRNTDSQQAIERRLNDAKNEIKEAPNFQFWLANDDFSETLKLLQNIFYNHSSPELKDAPKNAQIAEEFSKLFSPSKI